MLNKIRSNTAKSKWQRFCAPTYKGIPIACPSTCFSVTPVENHIWDSHPKSHPPGTEAATWGNTWNLWRLLPSTEADWQRLAALGRLRTAQGIPGHLCGHNTHHTNGWVDRTFQVSVHLRIHTHNQPPTWIIDIKGSAFGIGEQIPFHKTVRRIAFFS